MAVTAGAALSSLLLPPASAAASPTAATATATTTASTATTTSTATSAARPGAFPPVPVSGREAATDAYLQGIKDEPNLLNDFFRQLPKGGELHNHLSGAVSTEFLVDLAADDGMCIDTGTMTAVAPPCGPGTRPATDARTDREFHDAIVRAWSMQDFPPGGNGHDHFFDAFGKFGAVTWKNRGKLLAEVADDAAEQRQFYVETMVTPASDGAKRLAAEVGWDANLADLHGKLVAGGRLDRLVAEASKEADGADAEFRTAGRCGTPNARPGCKLPVRWISQVSRGAAPERVFTQLALGMRLSERDGRFVAVNLVQPEDGERALRDYSLQMRMVQYLRSVYPKAHVTLHAGELWPGLVKPEDLKFHIRDAVSVAGAERIGHGVDLVHEDDWQSTASTMAAREVAVEVPFTSNAQILGVRGADHPFETYRRHGVPVVLATDDPGISRVDISHEYQYAAETYDLSYPQLKDLARASLEYAFLPGRSLWRGNPTRDGHRFATACIGSVPGLLPPTPACRSLLASSAKAELQWEQEAALYRFEREFRPGRPWTTSRATGA